MFVSLRYRDFRIVWLGSLIEHFGEFMEVATVLWLVNQLTHSPLMLTIVGTARFVPMIFFPIVAGVVADRVNRRTMLIIALGGGAFLSLCLALLAATGIIAIWHLVLIFLLVGVATSFNHPARASIVPNLIKKEHLLNALSLDFISIFASRMVGMALAGHLIGIFGIWPIFVIRAVGCLLAIYLLILARIPPTSRLAREQTPLQNLAAGFSYLRSNTVILSLVILYLIPWLTGNTLSSFLPLFSSDILHVEAVWYGYLQAAPGLGSLIALVGLTLLTYYKRKIKLLVVAGLIMGICLIGFSASPWLFLSLPLLVVIGAMQTAFTAVNTTIIQSTVPDELRGRVMSLREVTYGLGPTGSILFGAMAQYTGVPISLGFLGMISLIPAILLITRLSHFESME